MRSYLTILFLFFSVLKLCASDVKCYNINTMFGISMRETYSVCKDGEGFVWASAKSGIIRMAEDDCRIYQLPYNTADVISVRLVCDSASLVACTNNGQLFLYDKLYDKFNLLLDLRVPLENRYLSANRIEIDSKQTLWVATSSGLCAYKEGELTVVVQENIHSIAPYDDAHLFVAMDHGIDVLNIHTGERKSLYVYTATDGIQVTTLFYSSDTARLWIGTLSDGLRYYDMKRAHFLEVPIRNFPKQPIRAIEGSADSTLWVGIDGKGIWELTREGETVLNVYKEDVDNPFSLHGDGVYDIFCDEKKRVWVTTYSGGLSFFEQGSPLVSQVVHQVNNPNSLGNNNVNKVLEDSRGDIWFATNNGISRWRVATNQWDTYYRNKQEQAQVFLTLCEDDRGHIWAGSYSSGFYILDGKTGRELAHYAQKADGLELSGRFIYDIFKDSAGDMWIGGIQDAICYSVKEKRFRAYQPQPVRSFAELAPGKMLLACTYGLILLDKESGDIDYLLGGYLVQDIVVVNKDVWIGTCGDGLIRYNCESRAAQKMTVSSGLSSNYVNSIMHTEGYLWLGTENGLCRLNLSDHTIHPYSSILSLSRASYNVNSCSELKNGELIWGTNNGAVMFDPSMLYQTQLNGQLYFQDIAISGRSIRENPTLLRDIPVDKQTDIRLNYNQNTLALELLPLGVSASEVKYSWIMEGLDTEWTHPSSYRIVTYTNMPNGELRLRVRMYDNSLSEVIDERTLNVHIIPPYWDTWWFRLLAFIALAALVSFLLRFYINRLKQRHTEDKIRFFTNTAHDIRTSLTLISAPIEELNKEKGLSEKGRHYLDMATEQSGRLSFVATQLLDFQKVDVGKGQLFLVMTDVVNLVYRRQAIFAAAAKKKGVALEFTTNQEAFVTAVDELKIEKVVDNLISNAIKYSHPDGKVEIALTCDASQWRLEVKDYGLGISDNAQKKLFREFYRGDNVVNSKMVGSGIGLLLVKNYVGMHGGDVAFESEEYKGSSFRFTLPYKKVDDVLPAEPTEHIAEAVVVDDCLPALPVDQEKEDLAAKSIHILIVEDNNDLQHFLKYSFEEQYRVSIAGDGVEAWKRIGQEAPDLIISDVMMPNMDGFELCRLVKSTFDTSHIPVILLTALSEKTSQMEGLGLGADDYITKPFDMTLLAQRIKNIVRNREVVREKALRLTKQTDDKQPILTNELNDQFVKKALEVVHAHLSDSGFGKDEFAAAMNVSPSLLYKKIKALTGQSPIELIKTIRLNAALELLQSHTYSVTEVSEQCGFSSINYFSTVFKKHFGKSPTEVE